VVHLETAITRGALRGVCPTLRRVISADTIIARRSSSPPILQDWLPEDHPARFISDIVDNEIDLTSFLEGCDNQEGGNPAFHPALMLKLWLYGYCAGIISS
jgi:transposase